MPGGTRQDTRAQAETSKALWASYQDLYTKSMAELHLYATETAPASLQRVTESLHGDTGDPEVLWEIWSRIKLVTNQDATYRRKISAVDKILSKMDDEILGTPVSSTVEGIVSSVDRQAAVSIYQGELDVAREILFHGSLLRAWRRTVIHLKLKLLVLSQSSLGMQNLIF